MRLEHVHYLFAGAFVDELAQAGVRDVCFAPGSRSTPLAVMLAEHPDIKLWTHLDERSASFFALGMAKASRRPVGLLCSSGTATANFYPAVIEARYSRVPLIVMTADRPPELQNVGAPQTIDQTELYGKHAKWFASVALPEATPDMLNYARSTAGRAVSTATSQPEGAVHLNFPFREPLMPIRPDDADVAHLIAAGNSRRAYRGSQGRRSVNIEQVRILASELAGRTRGLIVCGPQDDPALGSAAVQLGQALGYPVLADPLSLARTGAHHSPCIIDSYDAFLKDRQLCSVLEPEAVIRFGAQPTAKPFLLYSQMHPDTWHVLVDGGDGWNDPALLSSDVVHADPVRFCHELNQAFPIAERDRRTEWLQDWIAIDKTSRHALLREVDQNSDLFEGRVFQELAAMLPDGSCLYAGNSMPVRDMDTFFQGGIRYVQFLSNRGANGIDGVVSSALGASATTDGPTVLVIGDLSFYHDMNGLLAAKLHQLNATVVLINNDGGGIFSFLPQAAHPEHFEALFGTPHGLDFAPVAELYGLEHNVISNWNEFREAVQASFESSGVQIVEVPAPDRARNVELHRKLWGDVREAIAGLELACLSTS